MTLEIGSLVYVPVNPNAVSDDYAPAIVVAVYPNDSDDVDDTVNVRVLSNNNELEWRTNIVMGDAPEKGATEAPGNVAWEPGASSAPTDATAETPIAAPSKGSAEPQKGA